MADTYSQIFYHIVFAVRNRESLITSSIQDELYKYISGIISNQKQKLFIINGMPDHVHILMNCKPNMNLSDNIREMKEHSSKYINSKNILSGKFYWQEGFAAFSVSKNNVSVILNYIKNQKDHHKIKTFKDEYMEFLKENDIDYKKEYLFNFDLT